MNRILIDIDTDGGIFDVLIQVTRLIAYSELYDNVRLYTDFTRFFESSLCHVEPKNDDDNVLFEKVFYEYLGDVVYPSVNDLSTVNIDECICVNIGHDNPHRDIQKHSRTIYLEESKGKTTRYYPNVLIKLKRKHISNIHLSNYNHISIKYEKEITQDNKNICVHMRLGDTARWTDENDNMYEKACNFYPEFDSNKNTYDAYFDMLEEKIDFQKINQLSIITDFSICAERGNKKLRHDKTFHERHLEKFMERYNNLPIKNKKLSVGTNIKETMKSLELLKESNLVIANRLNSGLPAMNHYKYKTPNIFVWDL